MVFEGVVYLAEPSSLFPIQYSREIALGRVTSDLAAKWQVSVVALLGLLAGRDLSFLWEH
jgi:hypothetical protein